MALFDAIAELPLSIEACELDGLQQNTAGGWTRLTTVVALRGGGHVGRGEDITYNDEDQRAFRKRGSTLGLEGRHTFAGFSRRLAEIELFPEPPREPKDRNYRIWAFESAALDLALRQAGTTLSAALEREPAPVSFVVSTGLGDPPGIAPLQKILALYPGTEFKVDLSPSWTEPLIGELARLGAIRVVDLKGQYRGTFQGPPANSDQYRCIAEFLPDVWIEDPELDDSTSAALEHHRARITWDAILHSVEDILALPFEPSCINVKPSRFGTVHELFRVYQHCALKGIEMYGGGQFELGPGRGQIQYLASLFHPGAPNDVAPIGFNERELPRGLQQSPLPPPIDTKGFSWSPQGH